MWFEPLLPRRSQSALEFLITYGWMIILIVAVVAVLFSIGIINITNFVSSAPVISGFNSVVVSQVAANQTNFDILLTNDLDVNVSLNRLTLFYNGSSFSALECTYLSLPPGESSFCMIPASLAAGKVKVNVQIDYAVSSFLNSTSNGSILFTTTTSKLAVPSSTTTFQQYGFPIGASWNVTYNGVTKSSSASSISFVTPFGSHSFTLYTSKVSNCTYTPVPSAGSLQAGYTESVDFTSSCEATFIEKNLPSGTTWTVIYDGTGQSSSNSMIAFVPVSSGSHSFTVQTLTYTGCSYAPSPSSGSLAVGEYQIIQFAGTCNTTFSENGLPPGRLWAVELASLNKSADAPSSITFFGAPGSFPYTVQTLANSTADCTTTYTPNPTSGTMTAGSTVVVSFSANTACTNAFTEEGLPSGDTWSVVYDGKQGSASTGNAITLSTSQSGSSFTSYTASASVSGLQCSASAAVEQGVGYNFGVWSCTTTFSESGLPSAYTWTMTYNSNGGSASAPNSIQYSATYTYSGSVFSYAYTIDTKTNSSGSYACTTTYSPSPGSGNANAGSTTQIVFSSSTQCTTTFDESGLSSNYPWNVTYNGITSGFVQATSTQIVTTSSGSAIPAFSYSLPSLTGYQIEWSYGTSAYQGQVYGMPVQAFSSALSDLNTQVSCSSPYNSEGFSATAYVYFSSSVTFTVWTDDGTEIFYQPYGSSSWNSVFGGNQWHGQGTSPSTAPYTSTISVTPGLYKVAVDWTNTCGGGMSFVGINGAQSLSSAFSVIAWTPNSNSVDLLPYSDVTANPVSPSAITIQQTGSFPLMHEDYNCYNSSANPSPSSSSATAGSTVGVAFSNSLSECTYVPVTLSNSQSSATPSGFEQYLNVNMANYESYANTEMSNVLFIWPNGTVIPSWRENASSYDEIATYWLKVGTIPANGNVGIQMLFTNQNVLNILNTGIAPQLSSTYAEYDSGAILFPYYWNFAGTSSSGITDATNGDGGTFTVNNGWSVKDAFGTYDAVGFYTTNAVSNDLTWNIYSSNILSANSEAPVQLSNSNSITTGGKSITNGWGGDFSGSLFTTTGGAYYYNSGTGGPTSIYTYSGYSYPALLSEAWYGSTLISYINGVEVGSTTSFSAFSQDSSIYGTTFLANGGAGGNNVIAVQYAFFSYTPPNGVMPSVSLGSVS